MKICYQGFLSKNMSWSVVGQNIARQLIKLNHQVDLFSTNGNSHFPNDLRYCLKDFIEENALKKMSISNDYNMCISYTAMRNFQQYLSHSKSNRFGIWCADVFGKNALPSGFAKQYKHTDKILPPTQFAKQSFLDSGVPSSYLEVIPHGIDDYYFDNTRESINLNIKDKIIIGSVIGQVHRRKNIDSLFEAYGKSFIKSDNVCLVIKVEDRPPRQSFELDFKTLFNKFKARYPNHAEVKIITDFIPEMDLFYRAIDIYFAIPHLESFGLPFLESLSIGKIVIASNWGGMVDFLNYNNSLLVSGKEANCPPDNLYWDQKYGTIHFVPNIDDAVDKLKYAVNNLDILKSQFKPNIDKVIHNYSWNNITKDILKLAK